MLKITLKSIFKSILKATLLSVLESILKAIFQPTFLVLGRDLLGPGAVGPVGIILTQWSNAHIGRHMPRFAVILRPTFVLILWPSTGYNSASRLEN